MYGWKVVALFGCQMVYVLLYYFSNIVLLITNMHIKLMVYFEDWQQLYIYIYRVYIYYTKANSILLLKNVPISLKIVQVCIYIADIFQQCYPVETIIIFYIVYP